MFDALLAPVQAFVENQDQQRTPHQNETFSSAAFFRLLAYYVVSEIPSIALFITTYLKKGLLSPALKLPYVPRSTFNDAFERFSPDLFRAVFTFLLSSLSLQVVPEIAALGVFYCIDGSLFPTVSIIQWAEYTSTTQALKLHLCFELNRMIPVDILVGSGKSSERHALRQMLTAGVTYIADQGYVSFQLFQDVLHAQAHLIFRMKANLKYHVTTRLSVDVPLAAQTLFQDITDGLIVCDNDPFGQHDRRVSFRVGTSQFLLLTDRRDLTTFQVMLLYAYRWQVELIFRFLKRTMNGIHLINQSQDGVTIHFHMLLIVSLLQLALKQQAVLAHESSVLSPSQETPPQMRESIQTQEPNQTPESSQMPESSQPSESSQT
ncbi:MAG: IS4 family transposase, partial [Planctomycetes bacterium]|nr:IS4 family transposase [Planctomycetota bacterium]